MKRTWIKGPWNFYGGSEPIQGGMEAGAGISIGSVHHTEPVARFSGYHIDSKENAKRAFDCFNAMEPDGPAAKLVKAMDDHLRCGEYFPCDVLEAFADLKELIVEECDE